MNLTQAKKIAINLLIKDNLGVFNLSGLEVSEESNSKVDVFLGGVDYIDDGDDVSSVFLLYCYKNGNIEMEWS